MESRSFYFLNGEIFPVDRCTISPFDRGLLYGDGLFETMRVYRGIPFLWEEHLRRLREGADFLEIPLPMSEEEVGRALARVLRVNQVKDGVVRMSLTRGPGPRGLVPPDRPEPTFLITATRGIPYDNGLYQRGYRAVVVSLRRNRYSPLPFYKTLNNLEGMIAAREARRSGADEGLFTNSDGYLCEGTLSNLFLVRKGVLLTPPKESGLLAGITRSQVIQLAREEGLPVEETPLELDDLLSAGEAFLTSSVLEIMPLVSVNGRLIGTGKPSPLTKRLTCLYRATVLNYMEKEVSRLLGLSESNL